VSLLREIGPISSDLENLFHGPKLEEYLANHEVKEEIRNMIKMIEMSMPDADSEIKENVGEVISLNGIYDDLILNLNPQSTIDLKTSMEVERPERLHEEKKDILDPIVVYPQFKRPMFEPLRDLSEDLLLPAVKDIQDNTISLLETNPTFINSYMVGLNHEMARELLWREYPTDQRGSYFRQFWDVSIAVQRERMTSSADIEEIVEKYRDIPEIHKWKSFALEEISNTSQTEQTVLLIKGEVLRRYPSIVIYASKAILIGSNQEPTLPSGNGTASVEEIVEPIFKGTIPPDIAFVGFDKSLEQLGGNNTSENPGYFFVLQEQPSEPRFGIDQGSEEQQPPPSINPDDLTSWDDLTWDYITLSSTSNGYIDLENGSLVGKEIDDIQWGKDGADLAYILLQRPVRIAVYAKEMLEGIE